MPRIEHRFALSIHDRYTGRKWTVHLCQMLHAGRFLLKRGGKNSDRTPEATSTEIGREIAKWLTAQQRRKWFRGL